MSMAAIVFTPDGLGHGLYTEAIDLGRIGSLSVKRATRIEFDNRAGRWRVYLACGCVAIFSSSSRQECLDWERQYLEQQEDQRHEQLSDGFGSVAVGA